MTRLTTHATRTFSPRSLVGLSVLLLASCEPSLIAASEVCEQPAPVEAASPNPSSDLDDDTVTTGRTTSVKKPVTGKPILRTPWTGTPGTRPPGGAGGGTTTSPGEPAEPAAPVRFVALGDAGEGNDAQYAVADAIEGVCAARGCEFAVYLGDNFYSTGVESLEDDQFVTKFEDPYANLTFPFYVANGNHDVDGGDAEWKKDIYVEYTDISDKWTMPAPYYSVDMGALQLFALHTTPLTSGDDGQGDWLLAELEASTADWKIVFGHHPYRSNGDHGNADESLEALFDDVVCGRADVYLAGHDHNLEWLEPQCGLELIVSGAGSKLRDMADNGTPSFFSTDQVEGFMWIEIDPVTDQFTGIFYDRDGNELFSQTVSR